jgi:hypothetical protein
MASESGYIHQMRDKKEEIWKFLYSAEPAILISTVPAGHMNACLQIRSNECMPANKVK